MHYRAKLFAAIIGGSAVVTLGALSVGVVEGQTAPASAAGSPQMTLGATSTETTPPNAPAVGEASPSIKGPAPLPTEEQGLPG
ncbi:MAG: hypothetical protein JWR11_174 [Mycobacterium sp.]|jgi:hypothetical protein|nr:hypothetical protein [Mycobacterium sp.]MDT5180811.1 hypothetical protein [Mycobacterium sp.]